MSGHTKGPWTSREDGKYRESPWLIEHEEGHGASWAPITSRSGRTLAVVVNDDTARWMDMHQAEMHANANLIAAAPEMLAALIRVADLDDKDFDGTVAAVHAAIARAKGESK